MATFAAFCYLIVVTVSLKLVSGGESPITDRTLRQQVVDLGNAGYDVSRLDDYTQLKVFLYTWLAMERSEDGACGGTRRTSFFSKYDCMQYLAAEGSTGRLDQLCAAILAGSIKLEPVPTRGCCAGWTMRMNICTKNSWYEGFDSASIKKTLATMERLMKS